MGKQSFLTSRPHPWHGIQIGKDAPKVVKAYIEIVPNDAIKYEICKETGYIKVDRPQKFSSLPSVLYGFIPQTYSAEKSTALSKVATHGDGDPVDICVLSELSIERADIIMDVRIIGGIKLIDNGEVDDKLIAVLDGDPFYEGIHDISQIHHVIVDRMRHYFLSYKTIPGEPPKTKIESVYGHEEAFKVVQAGMEDYKNHFN
ncbi:inorganic pyrophosphatase [Bacteriovorax stolpii]|uniref:inorganic diphosphatase n=1 Tax=Bacteriovorax stolpii TaxID=960 RepID=A0A2K9NTV1_BACTC|nr:inorganic pyrophosphatase [Bacteriovorax stolpii]AUN98917.1 inorganic pyrophosphatase [Bacteriovorax stolpii]QDK41087.1 inorganic pyrophosphatase [Bacteriovorax stolpii]TDP55557.1 inorganic pyrophosphatase [Bacteriovorax stolpii]